MAERYTGPTLDPAEKLARLKSITVALIAALATGACAAWGGPQKLSRKQVESDVKAQFDSWFANTFTKCGESYFAKSQHYPYVFELVGPSISFGRMDQSFDELNKITTLTVAIQWTAKKSRMSARPDTLLWRPGLVGLRTDGDPNADLTIIASNDHWTVQPGSWYYEQRMGPIPCSEVPQTMAPASYTSSAQNVATPSAGAPAQARPWPGSTVAESSTAANAAPEADWYLLGPLSCERQDPRTTLVSAQLLGASVVAHDVKENGKVVATTLTAADGSSARYYRGKGRCEAVLNRALEDLDRYK